MRNSHLLLVGSYTHPEAQAPSACGDGISVFSFDSNSGALELRGVYRDIVNPSYLAFDIATRHLFAASENMADTGHIYQFLVGPEGDLLPIARQSSHGVATCHLAVLPGGSVCAASYFGGIAVCPLREGVLAPATHVIQYQGRGPNPQRQEAPHPHHVAVAPGGRWFYVCDLGADCVWRHDITLETPPERLAMPAGHGPRHMAFHPKLPRAYVVGELTGAVAVCDWDARTGSLELAGTTRTLGQDAAAGAIRPHSSGRMLYISVRKSSSLLAFPLDDRGWPGEPAEMPLPQSGTPRDFDISPDGRWLICANQSAGMLSLLELEPGTGRPTSGVSTLHPVKSPASVLFIPSET